MNYYKELFSETNFFLNDKNRLKIELDDLESELDKIKIPELVK